MLFPNSIMGAAVTLVETIVIDDISYDLFKDESGRGYIRVYDVESGNVADIVRYPIFAKARAEYCKTLDIVSEV